MAGHRKQSKEHLPLAFNPMYTRSGEVSQAPRHEMPDGEMDPATAVQFVLDELMLDGNARLNLATFVTTWMEPEARVLMAETFDKDMIAKDEHPRTAEIAQPRARTLSRLTNSPAADEAAGPAPRGSGQRGRLAGT